MSTDTKAVEGILASSHALLTVSDLRRVTGLDEPTVRAQLKALAQQGQIEHIPGRGRYDGKYGLLRTTPQATVKDPLTAQAPDYDPRSVSFNPVARADAAQDETAGLRAELAATEQKRLATTAALTAAMKQLDAIRAHLSPFPADPSGMTEVELAEHAAAAIRDGLDRIFSKSADDGAAGKLASDLRAELDNAKALNDKLEHLLGSERTASAALREQLEHITNGGEPAAPGLCASLIDSFAVIAPKRPMRRFTAHDSAVKSAMAAASNGSKRGEVFALVHVGSAKRGAVWSPK